MNTPRSGVKYRAFLPKSQAHKAFASTTTASHLHAQTSGPDRTRTCRLQIRNLALYPDELRARKIFCQTIRTGQNHDSFAKAMNAYSPVSYCESSKKHEALRRHHDFEHGRPERDSARLLEFLALEIFQAGLNWRLVLEKREALRQAFFHFAPARLAACGQREIRLWMANKDIIRNRLKLQAMIYNAQRVQNWKEGGGGFADWLERHHPQPPPEWVKIFRKQFRFVGPEIVREFLTGTGFLPGAHQPDCPRYAEILALHPPWARSG